MVVSVLSSIVGGKIRGRVWQRLSHLTIQSLTIHHVRPSLCTLAWPLQRTVIAVCPTHLEGRCEYAAVATGPEVRVCECGEVDVGPSRSR